MYIYICKFREKPFRDTCFVKNFAYLALINSLFNFSISLTLFLKRSQGRRCSSSPMFNGHNKRVVGMFHILILVKKTVLVKSRRFDRATVILIIRSWERWYVDQGKGVNELQWSRFSWGHLYRRGTIGIKNFALVEMWNKYLQSVREMDGMKSDKIGSEWLGEGTGWVKSFSMRLFPVHWRLIDGLQFLMASASRIESCVMFGSWCRIIVFSTVLARFLFVDGSWVLLRATISKVHGDAAREGCYWLSYVGFYLKCTVFMGASIAIDNVCSFECWFYGDVIVLWEQLRDVMLLVDDGEFNFIVGVITFYIV